MSKSIPSLRLAPRCFVALLIAGLATETVAQPPARSRAEPSRQRTAAEPKEETSEGAEAAALALVRRHLPQLTELLKTLRRDAPDQYDKAIADLARQARRLEASRRRDPRLFEIELEILKRQTRVDLGVARLQFRDDPKTRLQLRRAIGDLQQARRARLEYEQDQLRQRMVRLEQQLQMVEERLQAPLIASPQWIDKAYRNLLRKAGRTPAADGDSAGGGDSAGDGSPATKDKDRVENETETAGSPTR